jgi:hypothetical protein
VLLSAFLGGFSSTFLAAILALETSKVPKVVDAMVAASALAACCFIICAVSSIATINGIQTLSLELEGGVSSLGVIKYSSGLSMAIGLLSLLTSIGISGWLRSTLTGFTTSLFAIVAIAIAGVLA